MNKISAVILAKNEEEHIEDCIKSLSWCDEVLIINDESSDTTESIAKKNNATVITRSLNGNFSHQRNFAMEKAKNDWILFVDADERVTTELAREIQKISEDTPIDGFFIRRIDYMWDKKLEYGETGNVSFLRLGRKSKGKWEGNVHEVWNISGKKGVLQGILEHYPHKNISEFLEKINVYTTIRAEELYKKGEKTNYFFIVAYPKGKFIQNYFLKFGILDGVPGLVHALLMSFHSFLVRGKLWLLWNKK